MNYYLKKEIKIEIYNIKIDIFVTSNIKKLNEIMLERIPGCKGCFYIGSYKNKPYLFLKNLNDIETMIHEILHIITEVAVWIGASLNTETQEPFAYLGGWLYNEIKKNNYDKIYFDEKNIDIKKEKKGK